MKRSVKIILVVLVILCALSACGKNGKYDNFREVYSVDYKYYFYVQPQYSESVSNLGYSNTIIVRYLDAAYAMVSAYDYYDNLSYEQIGGNAREDYTIGNPAVDSTFNDRDYIQDYFESYLRSSSSFADISQIKKIEVNDHTFWMCRCYYYNSSFDPSTQDPSSNLSGEGIFYYTIYDGISYFINVTSVDSYLTAVPEAEEFIGNFFIGTRLQGGIKVVWALLALLVVLDLLFVLSAFFKIKVEPAVIIEVIKRRLIDLFAGVGRLSSEQFDNKLKGIELDRILGRIEIEASPEDEACVKNIACVITLDEILGRFKKEKPTVSAAYDPFYKLDVILGRKQESPSVFSPKPFEGAPVLSAISLIMSGAYNEKEETPVFADSLDSTLDALLGRKAAVTYNFATVAAQENFATRLQAFLQSSSEKSSIRRAAFTVKRTQARIRRNEKLSLISQKLAENFDRFFSEGVKKRCLALDAKFTDMAHPTYIPDTFSDDISNASLNFKLDTILTRTLCSKLDFVLERTVFTNKPFYDIQTFDTIALRKRDIKNAKREKANIEAERISRIQHIQNASHVIYTASPSQKLGASCISDVLETIRAGAYIHSDNYAIFTYQGEVAKPVVKENAMLKLQAFMQEASEKSSVRRNARNVKLQADRQRHTLEKAEMKRLAEERKILRTQEALSSKCKVLYDECEKAAPATYIPDIYFEDVSDEALCFKMDTILTRTLNSKIDVILGHTVLYNRPCYGEATDEVSAKLKQSINKAKVDKQKLIEEKKARIVHLADNAHTIYLGASSEKDKSLLVDEALAAIYAGKFDHYEKPEEVSVPYEQRKTEGRRNAPAGYCVYIKAERFLQKLSSVISAFFSRVKGSIKNKRTEGLAKKTDKLQKKADVFEQTAAGQSQDTPPVKAEGENDNFTSGRFSDKDK